MLFCNGRKNFCLFLLLYVYIWYQATTVFCESKLKKNCEWPDLASSRWIWELMNEGELCELSLDFAFECATKSFLSVWLKLHFDLILDNKELGLSCIYKFSWILGNVTFDLALFVTCVYFGVMYQCKFCISLQVQIGQKHTQTFIQICSWFQMSSQITCFLLIWQSDWTFLPMVLTPCLAF